MEKKRMNVLITINGLRCGGAEKSLVSFLNEIPMQFIIDNKINIDLLILDDDEIFFDNIPRWVSCITPCEEIRGIFQNFKEIFGPQLLTIQGMKKIIAKFIMKISRQKDLDRVQHVWKAWKLLIPKLEKEYDLAISYVDGFSNYYVIDKVQAERKILWVHNEYQKLSYNSDFDRNYFEQAERVETISKCCKESLQQVFPEYKEKIFAIPNLSSKHSIYKLASVGKPLEYGNHKCVFLSVGRLNEQKGFDLAIKTASVLRDRGVNFCWFIMGEGELEKQLQEMIIQYELQDCFKLIGVRENPYPYINYCDLFIQPSRYEGKSIVLDEAKILEKPIVVTNYLTVHDSILDGITGTIVEFDEKKMADAIESLVYNKEMQQLYISNLHEENKQGSQSISDYLELFQYSQIGGNEI